MNNTELLKLRYALRFFVALSTVAVTMAVLLAFEVLELRDKLDCVL